MAPEIQPYRRLYDARDALLCALGHNAQVYTGEPHIAPVKKASQGPSHRAAGRSDRSSTQSEQDWKDLNFGFDALLSLIIPRLSVIDMRDLDFEITGAYRTLLERMCDLSRVSPFNLPDSDDYVNNPVLLARSMITSTGIRSFERLEMALDNVSNHDDGQDCSTPTPASLVASSFANLLRFFTIDRKNLIFSDPQQTITFGDLKQVGCVSLEPIKVSFNGGEGLTLGTGELDGLAYVGDFLINKELSGPALVADILEQSSDSVVFIEEFKLLSGKPSVKPKVLRQLLSYGIAMAGNLASQEGMTKARLDDYISRINLLLLQGFPEEANHRVIKLADFISVNEDLTLEFDMDFENGQVERLFRNGLMHIADLQVLELFRQIQLLDSVGFVGLIRQRILDRVRVESQRQSDLIWSGDDKDPAVTDGLFGLEIAQSGEPVITAHDRMIPIAVSLDELIGAIKSAQRVVTYADGTVKIDFNSTQSVSIVVPAVNNMHRVNWMEYHYSDETYLFYASYLNTEDRGVTNMDLDIIRFLIRYLNHEIVEFEKRGYVYMGEEFERDELLYGVNCYQDRFVESMRNLDQLDIERLPNRKQRKLQTELLQALNGLFAEYNCNVKNLAEIGVGITTHITRLIQNLSLYIKEFVSLGLDFGFYSYWNPHTWNSNRYNGMYERPYLTFPMYNFTELLDDPDRPRDHQVGFMFHKLGNKGRRVIKSRALDVNTKRKENVDAFVYGSLEHVDVAPTIIVFSDNPLDAFLFKQVLDENYASMELISTVAICPRYASGARIIAGKLDRLMKGGVFIDISRGGYALDTKNMAINHEGMNQLDMDRLFQEIDGIFFRRPEDDVPSF